MLHIIRLDRNVNKQLIAEQEQARFIKSLMEALEIPLKIDIFKISSVEEKIELRQALNEYSINIIDDLAGGLKVFAERELIAEWKKPQFKIKEEVAHNDKDTKIYLEMTINFWSVFAQ